MPNTYPGPFSCLSGTAHGGVKSQVYESSLRTCRVASDGSRACQEVDSLGTYWFENDHMRLGQHFGSTRNRFLIVTLAVLSLPVGLIVIENQPWFQNLFPVILPYACAGPSWCRLGCPDIPGDIGTQDRTDGTYLFPEGLAHYVRVHAVRPAEAFLEHLRANNYRVPRLPALAK